MNIRKWLIYVYESLFFFSFLISKTNFTNFKNYSTLLGSAAIDLTDDFRMYVHTHFFFLHNITRVICVKILSLCLFDSLTSLKRCQEIRYIYHCVKINKKNRIPIRNEKKTHKLIKKFTFLLFCLI